MPKRGYFALEKRKRFVEEEEDDLRMSSHRRSAYNFEETPEDVIRRKDEEIAALKAELENHRKREEMYKVQFQRLQKSMSQGGYMHSYVRYVDAF